MAAKKQYEVIVALAIAKTPEGGDLYLYHGSPVPDGVDEKEVERLLEGEFIKEVDAPAETPETDEPKSVDDFTVAELDAEIAQRNEGREDADKVVPADPGNKPEKVAALKADDEKITAKAAQQ